MAIKPVQVNMEVAVDDILVAVRDLIIGVKSGKPVTDLLGVELASFIKILGEVNQIPGDLENNLQSVLSSAGVRIGEIVAVLVGKYQP